MAQPATGIIGTVLGGTALAGLMGNNNGNGFLGGLFGGNRCGDQAYETVETAKLREQVAILNAQNMSREAGTKAFTDAVTYASSENDKQNTNIKELFNVVIAQGQDLAVLKTEIKCDKQLLEERMTCMYNALNTKFDNYVPWAHKIDSSLLCPQPTFPNK